MNCACVVYIEPGGADDMVVEYIDNPTLRSEPGLVVVKGTDSKEGTPTELWVPLDSLYSVRLFFSDDNQTDSSGFRPQLDED